MLRREALQNFYAKEWAAKKFMLRKETNTFFFHTQEQDKRQNSNPYCEYVMVLSITKKPSLVKWRIIEVALKKEE